MIFCIWIAFWKEKKIALIFSFFSEYLFFIHFNILQFEIVQKMKLLDGRWTQKCSGFEIQKSYDFSWIVFIAGFDQYCQYSIHTYPVASIWLQELFNNSETTVSYFFTIDCEMLKPQIWSKEEFRGYLLMK